MLIHKISPKYDSSKLQHPTFDDIIDVFEDRVNGWMMDWADYLNREEHAGFSVLHIGMSYFECVAIFLRGKSSNKKGLSFKFFSFAFQQVFSGTLNQYTRSGVKQIIELMYKQGRCGFYHFGMAKKEIGLQDGELFTVSEEDGKVKAVWIDRYKFIDGIKKHFRNYVLSLRDENEKDVRKNFIKGWNITHADPIFQKRQQSQVNETNNPSTIL